MDDDWICPTPRASAAPAESPYGAHSPPAPDKTVRPTFSIEKLENLTIDAIAHRHETDHRIVQQLGGRALLDRNAPGPASGSGCGFASLPPDRTPGRQADTSPGSSV